MEITIKNNSDGTTAGVTNENQLEVEAEIHELQHHVAFKNELSFQCQATITAASGTESILHITNNDSKRQMVVSFVRTQLISTSATLPEAGTYFNIGYGQTISAGSPVSAVNTNKSSGKTADITSIEDGTLSGTIEELDRYHFTGVGDKETYNKQGSLVLGLGDAISLNIVTTAAASVYVRVTFMMIDNP